MPGLLELSLNQNNDDYNDVRWKLLKWMVFGDDVFPEFEIQNIPKGYMIAVVTVMYLSKVR